jgi:hypothetical protein
MLNGRKGAASFGGSNGATGSLVLEPGGSMSANDLVKNSLGRPQNMAAFQKWMGEKFETRKLCTSLVTQTRGSFFPFRRLVFVRLCRGLKEHR